MTDFSMWGQLQFNELKNDLNPCNEQGDIDPHKLNQILGKFAGHMAWLTVIAETEANNLSTAEIEYDKWYKEKYVQAYSQIMAEEGAHAKPTVKSIEARVTIIAGQDDIEHKKRIADAKSRTDLLRGFVKVLDRQANVLTALSSNLRSELYFANGIPLQRPPTPENIEKTRQRLIRVTSKREEE